MAQVPQAHLWLAGSGPLEGQLKDQVAKLNLTQRIHFIGWQSNPTPFFKAADIFVCPSRHEPLGSIFIESWIHKVPVISTASEGPASAITNNIDGLLTPIDDVNELATAINKLIASKTMRIELINNGMKTYNKNHSEEHIVAQYIEFFKKILKNKQ